MHIHNVLAIHDVQFCRTIADFIRRNPSAVRMFCVEGKDRQEAQKEEQ